MGMDIQKISLVQASFALLEDRTDEAATLFYQRLFELEPGLRPLFHNDLHQQGAKFMATLAFIVTSLKKPEAMIPAIKQLGQRHVIYGVRQEHYRLVNGALSWSLKQMLGDSFTPEVAEAWDDVYYLIAGLMKEAASQVTFQQAYDQGVLQDPQA
jgi:hemoglobin-like flavoprotein